MKPGKLLHLVVVVGLAVVALLAVQAAAQASVPAPEGSAAPASFAWIKTVNDELWADGMTVTVQTSDTIVIADTVVCPLLLFGFELFEDWDPDKLALTGYQQVPPLGDVEVDLAAGTMTWSVSSCTAGDVLLLTKQFRVEPCDWTETLLWEELHLSFPPEQRTVTFYKMPPALWINASYWREVAPGMPAEFTLLYGNGGGNEVGVWIRNDFPVEAPFVSSVPPHTNKDPNGRWAEWYIGDLPQGAQRSIDVTVSIAPSTPPTTTLTIRDYIFDHLMLEQERVTITLHVEPPPVVWTKMVGGPPWTPGISVTVEPSHTIPIVEEMELYPLSLFDYTSPHASAPLPPPPVVTLWDQVASGDYGHKSEYYTDKHAGVFSADDLQNSDWWQIASIAVVGMSSLDLATADSLSWTLYADLGGQPAGYPDGGPEGPLWTLSLPPSHPAVTRSGPPTNETITLDLDLGLGGSLTLPPGHYWLVFYPSFDWDPLRMWGWRYADTTNGAPSMWIDPDGVVGGSPTWAPTVSPSGQTDHAFRLEGLVLEMPVVQQVERWNPAWLEVSHATHYGGTLVEDPAAGVMTWTVEIDQPGTVMLDKGFHVKPGPWYTTLLEEELWWGGALMEYRPVEVVRRIWPVYLPLVLRAYP